MSRALIEPDVLNEAKSDTIDMASVHEAMNLAAALRNVPRPHIPATGQCLYCDADLPLGERWCPANEGEMVEDTCMWAWEREQERRRANGSS